MGPTEQIIQALGGTTALVRARVSSLEPEGRVRVACGTDGAVELLCDVLATSATPVAIAPGDEVLVAAADRASGALGIVLGRIGATNAQSEPSATARERRVVIEADEELILRVGDSSIRIARDGKVVIRGEHVLTRAKGTNRIKGGSVAIN